MTRAMWIFGLATLIPVPLLAAGAAWGGAWTWAALGYVTLLTAALDEAVALSLPPDPEGREFPAADGLSMALAVLHFGLLALCIRGLSGPALSGGEKLALFFAAGLYFGQVSNSNAHELIHRSRRGLVRLGRWVFISLLFGHHASAHPLVHHVHVGTDRDPNSARRGQSYYGFVPRAWAGSFRAGLAAETARLARRGAPAWRHPYLVYVGGALACLGAAFAIGGWAGVGWHLLLAGHAQAQLLLSDYVQHYGLRRRIMADGRPEPAGPRHSWNSPHWASSALMLNAPRHSDHHAHPGRPYPALQLAEGMPVLPRSLPVMGAIALAPRLWRRIMDPRVAALTAS